MDDLYEKEGTRKPRHKKSFLDKLHSSSLSPMNATISVAPYARATGELKKGFQALMQIVSKRWKDLPAIQQAKYQAEALDLNTKEEANFEAALEADRKPAAESDSSEGTKFPAQQQQQQQPDAHTLAMIRSMLQQASTRTNQRAPQQQQPVPEQPNQTENSGSNLALALTLLLRNRNHSFQSQAPTVPPQQPQNAPNTQAVLQQILSLLTRGGGTETALQSNAGFMGTQQNNPTVNQEQANSGQFSTYVPHHSSRQNQQQQPLSMFQQQSGTTFGRQQQFQSQPLSPQIPPGGNDSQIQLLLSLIAAQQNSSGTGSSTISATQLLHQMMQQQSQSKPNSNDQPPK